MPSLSVIIPTCNMAPLLAALTRACAEAGVFDLAAEVLFVDDGSTDDTPAVLARAIADVPRARVLTLPVNQGRYAARLAGARAAAHDRLLFLDTRALPPPSFGRALAERLDHGCAMVAVRIDVEKSLFNLYWERTHAFIFARNRRDEARGFEVTAANYGSYVTGTTGLLCRRDDFLAACATFGARDLRSDDTYLMLEIARRRPIFVRDDWFVWWEPRQSARDFLNRLWDRGPGFAEYHVFTRRGLYFYVLCASFAFVLATGALVVAAPAAGLSLAIGAVFAVALSTALFARGPVEFVRLAPLHVATCMVAGLAAARGVVVCLQDARRRSA